ncbi:MAG: phytoene desaturase family protein [Leadbetterella sp.]
MKKVIVIGSGFAGLSSATKLASQGYDVTVLEKNSTLGGRARVFKENGFTFDMGPSWYWMPDIFENYFATFGKKPSDYYDLVRLDPSYRVILKGGEAIDLPADPQKLKALFERFEPGCGEKYDKFLEESKYKYQVGIGEFVWKPSLSITEFFDFRLVSKAVSLDLFASFAKHIRKYFTHPTLLKIMEFPVLFLGATPKDTPALYSLMNYAEMQLGTWYPMGGMHEIIRGMVRLAEDKGVKFLTNQTVLKIESENERVQSVVTKETRYKADIIVSGADYAHTEDLLGTERNYSERYWSKRTMAPSSLLFYLGINRTVEKLTHHNLFFDEDFDQHAKEIYTKPSWPLKPLFYASAPSKTDPSVAPEGCENLFLLVPIAPDLVDNIEKREEYFNILMDRLEKYVGHPIKEHIVYKRSYAVNDFKSDYNAFKGNAYGLANTLLQTAFLKPRIKNRHIKNMYYTGQLSVPGPGVPPSIISGLVVADYITKNN